VAHQKRARPSSKDVAEAAGVSRTTVSFVLNDRPGAAIPPATRQRVLDAAASLGYFPSPEAKALKTGRSSIVLCLLPDWPITGPLGVLLKQLSARLADAGLTMLSHQRNAAEDLVQVLQSTTPAAVVAMCELTVGEAEFASRRGVELVAWMGSIPGHADEAGLHQSDVGRLQVTELSRLGHLRIAYALPHDTELAWFSDPRRDGAAERAQELGLGFEQFRLTDDAGSTAGLLEGVTKNGATGICAYNDEVAYSVIKAAHRLDLEVPRDLSVVGVDDSVISRLSEPGITSVAFELAQEAKSLAALLTTRADLTAGGTTPSQPAMQRPEVIRLVQRESTTVARPTALNRL
jgi:DNA-binding LacI/PurR family transcriptional regulator